MTVVEKANAASQNLRKTYNDLGAATPGGRVWSEPGFDACTGPSEHPICNFALKLELDPWSARRLAELAADKPHFQVYSMPGDAPAHREELLERVGFRSVHSLVQMVAEPQGVSGDEATLVLAENVSERRELARFMTQQFFPRQSPDFRRTVAEATSSAERLQLFSALGAEAGVMVSEDPEIVGLYNLCVAPKWRGRGIGSSIVRSVLSIAFRTGRPVTLQCDSRLETWYCSLGFRTVGYIRVFSGEKPIELI